MEKLSTDRINEYLNFGNLSQPFIEKSVLENMVQQEKQNMIKAGKSPNIIKCLMKIVNDNIRYSSDQSIQCQKFGRTVKEIWESKLSSGCTDTATVFASIARVFGIPTTILHTAQFEWLENLKNRNNKGVQGHTFCECFYENEWVLADVVARRITQNYDPNKIVLDYDLGQSHTFVAYYRGLDLGQKMTTKEHNKIMEEECLKMIYSS